MSHIHVQILSQNLSNNLDSHLRVPVFLFFLPPFCSGVIVYLGSHRTVYIVDLGIVISLQLVFLPLHFFLLHLLCISIPIFFLGIFCFQVRGWTAHRWDIVVPIHTLLLMTCCFELIYLGPLGGESLPALMGHFLHWVSPPS